MIYSPGDPTRNKEKMTTPSHHSARITGVRRVSGPSTMDSWLGPTRRGTTDKQLSPARVRAWWGGTAGVRWRAREVQSRDKQEAGRKSGVRHMWPRAVPGHILRMAGRDCDRGGDQKVPGFGCLAGAPWSQSLGSLPGGEIFFLHVNGVPACKQSERVMRHFGMSGLWQPGRTVIRHGLRPLTGESKLAVRPAHKH